MEYISSDHKRRYGNSILCIHAPHFPSNSDRYSVATNPDPIRRSLAHRRWRRLDHGDDANEHIGSGSPGDGGTSWRRWKCLGPARHDYTARLFANNRYFIRQRNYKPECDVAHFHRRSGRLNGGRMGRCTQHRISRRVCDLPLNAPDRLSFGGYGPAPDQFPSAVTLPYDNTAGFLMGVALANLSTSFASVTVTMWDDLGNQLGTQNLSIAGSGHAAFVLPNQFPLTSGKRGILRFQATGGIAGLGLRFSPFGTFTSVPAM
jgi:hypothetical protein